MRVFLLAFCILAAMVGVRGQAPADKLTPEEYIEANELSRNFFNRLLDTGNTKAVIRKFGTQDFNECVSENGFALFPFESVRDFPRDHIVRIYYADTDFATMFIVAIPLDDGDLTRESLPRRVQKRLGTKAIDFILGPDNSKRQDEYMQMVRSLERANPVFRREMLRAKASRSEKLRRSLHSLETESSVAEYLFRPELSEKPKGCGLNPETSRVINVDVPMYQLQLVRVGTKLKVFRYVAHVH